MNRKPLALAIMLVIAGLAPAAAIVGFCARMPCCEHSAPAPVVLSTQTDDCCTTITCYETPSVKLTKRASSDAVLTMPAVVSVPIVASRACTEREFVDTSPPLGTRHRLAILSILLI